MTDSITIEEIPCKDISGRYGWYILVAYILAWDTVSIMSRKREKAPYKMETMSSAIWRNLTDPKKALPLAVIWLGVTHHLFGSQKARQSYTVTITRRKQK